MPESTAPERPVPAGAELGRRRARFTYLMRAARKAVDGEPRLTPDELRALAGIYGEAAGDRAEASLWTNAATITRT
jgi:hypothetical protein